MKKKRRQNILWILIITCGIVIIFFFDRTTLKDNLISISGILREKPIEKIYGGDVPRYNYIFKIYRNNYRFKLSGCAYKMIDRDEILSWGEGDSITFYLEEVNPLIKNREVYGISWYNKEILSISSFNSCERRDTTLLLLVLIGLNVYLIYRFLMAR
ncbi:hypothetical protein [Fulvivirga sediminis]|uniref:Uncharacterized protein n=1 Tax=Fulvivirga sediminis TaxID=2803949 RepID=A0A937F588_9BACT|nr:hypothetical protein [Fulvivirga sediminis]MBL3656657.1 hypothetical protein [Fulvivirga sediminis]